MIRLRENLIQEQNLSISNQSRTLADIRDTLLPKLMSGEIRVKEAESTIEEIA